jgi:DNA-binding IclR family transcriptional regulator
MTASRSRKDSSRYEVTVVANALAMLEILGEQPETPLSTSSASARLGISRSTAYRLLVTLGNRGFVQHERAGWKLGWRLFRLAQHSWAESIRHAALPTMRRILEEVGETVNLAIYGAGELVYVASLDSPHPFRVTEAPGELAPLHSSALGKAVLAFLGPPEQEQAIAAIDFVSLTSQTVQSRTQLEAQLKETRRRGWALEEGETEAGVSCVGVAVLDSAKSPIAAMSVSVPDIRVTPGRFETIGSLMVREARELSARLATHAPAGV